jgi:hypothetical protein
MMLSWRLLTMPSLFPASFETREDLNMTSQ